MPEIHSPFPQNLFIAELPAWDGIDRLSTWGTQVFNSTGETADHCAKLVMDMTRRAMPVQTNTAGLIMQGAGCRVDHLYVLKGPWGCGKSRVLQILAGAQGVDVSVEELLQARHGPLHYEWLIEIPELHRKSEVEALKYLHAHTHDQIRLKFQKDSVLFPRTAVLVCTTNDPKSPLLNNDSRRCLPIFVSGMANLEWLEANREQLFAQAKHVVLSEKEAAHA